MAHHDGEMLFEELLNAYKGEWSGCAACGTRVEPPTCAHDEDERDWLNRYFAMLQKGEVGALDAFDFSAHRPPPKRRHGSPWQPRKALEVVFSADEQ